MKHSLQTLGLCYFECLRPFSLTFFFSRTTASERNDKKSDDEKIKYNFAVKPKLNPFQSSFNVDFRNSQRIKKKKCLTLNESFANLLSSTEIFVPHDFLEVSEERDTSKYSKKEMFSHDWTWLERRKWQWRTTWNWCYSHLAKWTWNEHMAFIHSIRQALVFDL